MANILNIDTSGSQCSVALSKDGEIVVGLESSEKMDHSKTLGPFVKQCFDFLKQHEEKLDAVSVAFGPGSYTGLRIGLSMAKGIAFGLNIPLISLSTLEIMAVRAIFTYPDFNGDEIIVPMIDARRMEVYTAAFNSLLKDILPEQSMILNDSSFSELQNIQKILFIGDGTDKFKELYRDDNAFWLGSDSSHAKFMVTLSEKKYRDRNFSSLAYTVPNYLKEYQATIPKNRII